MDKLTQSVEEYLEAIFKLTRDGSPVTVGQVAEALDVSPPSVSEMVRRLRAAGLVADDRGSGVTLTADGRAEGARLVRRHRLSERFLVDVLDMPWDAVHEEACKLEHALSPEVEARLAAQLGNPRTCPHGQVIPDEDGELDEEPAPPAVRRSTPATPARSAASPKRRPTSCATSPRSACCPTPTSRSRASPRSAAPSWCASPARSTRSDARWRARSWSAAER